MPSEHDCLALTGGRQRAIEPTPARIAARVFAPDGRDPGCHPLRISQEVSITQAVLAREEGKRFVEHYDGPEQESLGFLAVVFEHGPGVREARQPCPLAECVATYRAFNVFLE